MFKNLFIAGVMLSLSSVAAATPILDQANDDLSVVAFNGNNILTWQQEVIVGTDGLLSQIDLNFRDSGTANIALNIGSGWQSDLHDYAMTFDALNGWNSIDVSSAGLNLSAGDSFMIVFEGAPNFAGSNDSAYYGSLYLRGDAYRDTYDINFRTYMSASEVSEPAAISLMLLGLMGFGLRKRTKL